MPLTPVPENAPQPIARPLPTLAAGRPLAAPRVVTEERNLTLEVFRAIADPIRMELLALIAATADRDQLESSLKTPHAADYCPPE